MSTKIGNVIINLTKNENALIIGDNIRIKYFKNKGKDQIALRVSAPREIVVGRELLTDAEKNHKEK